MKTVSVKDVGVDNSAHKSFGDPMEVAHESHFFIHLEDTDLGEAEYALHYRFSDDGYLQLIYFVEGLPVQIAAQFKNAGRDWREELKEALKKYLQASSFWVGYPNYQDSLILTQNEFEQLVQDIKEEESRIRELAYATKTDLILYLEYLGLEPKPMGDKADHWFAICPVRTFRHPMDIYTHDDTWFCGYCSKNGNFHDFKRRIEHLYLSKYHAAINSGEEIPSYLKKWWWDRY